MTDFINNNGFDPKFNGAQFNTNKHGKGKAPDGQPAPSESAPVDRYADQKLSPDQVFALMNQQAQFNKTTGAASIFSSIAAFESAIDPEAHAKMMHEVGQVFQDEFGFTPSSELAESVVADRLVGKPHIHPNNV